MAYLFFSADKNQTFDANGEGKQGTLGEHLDYLSRFGGTPDCFDSCDTDSRQVALTKARESGLHLHVVDENKMRVVGVVNGENA